MPKKTKVPPETDPTRRKRYGEELFDTWAVVRVASERAFAAILFASIHAALPGIQDRNAAYQTEVYERCFQAAKKALQRLKP